MSTIRDLQHRARRQSAHASEPVSFGDAAPERGVPIFHVGDPGQTVSRGDGPESPARFAAGRRVLSREELGVLHLLESDVQAGANRRAIGQ